MQEKENHFIKNIEIKNFKCFEDFKAEGFGRVNLIGGKNNVGKTAFMESLFIASENNSETLLFINSFIFLEELRGLLTIDDIHTIGNVINIFEKFNNLKILTDSFSLNLEVRKSELESKYFINDRDTYISFDKSKITLSKEKFNNFIPSYMINDYLIISIFDKIKKQRKRDKLNQILNQFDKNILEFDIIENRPQVFLESQEKFQDVAELGHGLKRYIAIIGSILINKNGFLFLDELENGVHHTHLDKLWNIILTLAKEQNVQVFATTHSDECIRALVTANREDVKTYQPKEHILKDDEIQFIELGRVDGKVDSIIFDFKELENEVAQNMEIRGW